MMEEEIYLSGVRLELCGEKVVEGAGGGMRVGEAGGEAIEVGSGRTWLEGLERQSGRTEVEKQEERGELSLIPYWSQR